MLKTLLSYIACLLIMCLSVYVFLWGIEFHQQNLERLNKPRWEVKR